MHRPTLSACIAGGKTQGAANVASGHWSDIQKLGSQTGEGNRHTIGQDNVTSGHIKALGNANAENGTLEYARHFRHHVLHDRAPKSKYCRFCDGKQI